MPSGVKRVVVIVFAVVFFSNPVSFQNALGTAIALAGVFAYSQVGGLYLWRSEHSSCSAGALV